MPQAKRTPETERFHYGDDDVGVDVPNGDPQLHEAGLNYGVESDETLKQCNRSLLEQVKALGLQIETLRSTSESKDRHIGTLNEQIDLTDIKNADNISELKARNEDAAARAEEFKIRADTMQMREQKFEKQIRRIAKRTIRFERKVESDSQRVARGPG